MKRKMWVRNMRVNLGEIGGMRRGVERDEIRKVSWGQLFKVEAQFLRLVSFLFIYLFIYLFIFLAGFLSKSC